MPHPYDQDDDRILHEREMADRERRSRPALCGVVAFTIGLKDKAYGGPEEGGWWFDTFEPMRTFICPASRGKALGRRLYAWCKAMNEGRPSIDSVNSIGRYIVEPGIQAAYPTERPHYE